MRRALLLTAALALAACEVVLGPDPSASNASVFDLVWTDLDRHYVAFDVRQVDWQHLRDVYRPQALAATSNTALAQAIASMFDSLADVHVNLFTPTKTWRYTGYDTRPSYFDAALIYSTKYVPSSAKTASFNIRHGVVAGTLLHVWIPSLGGSGWDRDMDAVLAAHPGVTGVILDIRNNGGGNNQTGRGLVARFAAARTLIGYTRYRSGPAHGDLTDFSAAHLLPGGTQHFTGPVVVLTSRTNYSAAEDLVQAARMLPNVTIVGDTTGGGASSPLYRELPNGWTYRFSQGLLYDEKKQLIEIVGIAPDVFVRETAADSTAGIDAVLEKGCEVLGKPRCGRP